MSEIKVQLLLILLVSRSVFCELPFREAQSLTPACTIDITTQTASVQPVFIRPGTNQFFRPGNRLGQLQLAANQPIELWCSSSWSSPVGAPNLITATCVRGQIFQFQNVLFNFNQFQCRERPRWTTRRSTTRCFGNGILVDVGYQVGGRWLHIYTVCHDLELETNWYVKYQLGPFADTNQRNVLRPNWTQLGFFTARNVDHLYTRPQQRRTIGLILDDVYAANSFVLPEPSELFLARGHIAAMSDFILATEQQATFHFLNAAPQWQNFNRLNWNSIELSSRRLAGSRGIHLDVYTGTHGFMKLWNGRNSWRGIFLDWPAKRIPAPMIYYKILINKADSSGVVLIGVNNPHLTLEEIELQGYIVCPDVGRQVTYVSWRRFDLMRGYSYACEVNEFLKVVPHIPEINNVRYGLLV